MWTPSIGEVPALPASLSVPLGRLRSAFAVSLVPTRAGRARSSCIMVNKAAGLTGGGAIVTSVCPPKIPSFPFPVSCFARCRHPLGRVLCPVVSVALDRGGRFFRVVGFSAGVRSAPQASNASCHRAQYSRRAGPPAFSVWSSLRDAPQAPQRSWSLRNPSWLSLPPVPWFLSSFALHARHSSMGWTSRKMSISMDVNAWRFRGVEVESRRFVDVAT